jgi:uncharacterized membrane protein
MNQAESGLAGLERVIGHILRVGIVASSICLASALVMMLTGHAPNSARLLSDTGIVILMATPAARVVASVVEYIRERDWVFVALTMIVLLALGGSVIAAFW